MTTILDNEREMRILTFRTAMALRIPKHEATSVVMEAICKANESWDTSSKASFRTYVWRVLHNICIDILRQNANPPISEADCDIIFEFIEDPIADTEKQAYYREILEEVKKDISNIKNEEHRTIIEDALLGGNEEVPLTPNERQIVYRFRQVLKDKYGDIFY